MHRNVYKSTKRIFGAKSFDTVTNKKLHILKVIYMCVIHHYPFDNTPGTICRNFANATLP